MSGLIQKRVRIVFNDSGIQTRTGLLTSFSNNYICFISDKTGREECINNNIVLKVEGISEKAGVQ